jgi:ATP-binding cassette subfamily F protein uup
VNQVLAFEGDGEIDHVIGGYSDYIAFKKTKAKPKQTPKTKDQDETSNAKPSTALQKKAKLTFKDKHALENLPSDIEKLDVEINDLTTQLANPKFYAEDPKAFNKAAEKLERKKREKDAAEIKLLELMELAEEVA